MVRENNGTPIAAFSANNLTATLTKKFGVASSSLLTLVTGRNYQLVMWFFDGAGFPRSKFVSMIVNTGGKVAGSEIQTDTMPAPIGDSGGFAYGDLSAAVTVSVVSQNRADVTGTVTNNSTKTGTASVYIEIRNSQGQVQSNNAPVSVKPMVPSGNITATISDTNLVPGEQYEARCFAMDFNNNVLSTIATKSFNTTQGGGGGTGGGITGLFSNPIVVAVLGGLALLVVSKNKRIRRTLHI